MKVSNSKFRLNYFLYIGLALVIISFILQFFCFSSLYADNPRSPVAELFSGLPIYVFYASILVFAPICEELVFRSWVMQNTSWKYLSFIGICAASYITFQSFIFTGLVTVILFYLFFVLKKEDIRLILLVSLTSILFGLAHLGNHLDLPQKILGVSNTVGVAFIICYLGLRFNFLYCILGHFIWNLIVAFFVFSFSSYYSGEIDKPTYTAIIESASSDHSRTQNLTYEGSAYFYPTPFVSDKFAPTRRSTVESSGPMAKIALTLSEYNRDTIYRYFIGDIHHYSYKVEAKSDMDLCPKALFNDFVSYANLRLDTTKVKAQRLRVVDSLKLTEQLSDDPFLLVYSLDHFARILRTNYRMPIIIDEEVSEIRMYQSETIPIDVYGKTQEEYLKFMEENFGLIVEDYPHKQAVLITISEGDPK